jgi:hypothetical protein
MSRRHYFAIGCFAGTTLFCEVALTRLFSVVEFYHGAFLAISLGLFGFAASGVFVFLRAGTLDRERLDSAIAFYGLLFGLSIPVCFYFYLYVGIGESRPRSRSPGPSSSTRSWPFPSSSQGPALRSCCFTALATPTACTGRTWSRRRAARSW